ncbi:hypothetical protein [Spirochaeta dissipatitropha]
MALRAVTKDEQITAPSEQKSGYLPRLDLKDLQASRRTLARLIRKFAAGDIDEQFFKTMLYSFQNYHTYLKSEKDFELEKRLDEIESNLRGRK